MEFNKDLNLEYFQNRILESEKIFSQLASKLESLEGQMNAAQSNSNFIKPILSPSISSDVRVQATNDDSIVSKCSASLLGYIIDPFLPYFVGENQTKRSTLINRGYYIRCQAIRTILKLFLTQPTDKKKQIVSFGSGYDTSFFCLHEEKLFSSQDTYFEVDFHDLIKRKSKMIQSNSQISSQIEDFRVNEHGEVIGTNYKLLAGDLRNLSALNKLIENGLDPNSPTLFFAECVFGYLLPQFSSNVISWCASNFPSSCFLAYEGTKPDDAFGSVMASKLLSKGSPLLSIDEFSNVELQKKRYQNCGYHNANAITMNEFWKFYLTPSERKRIEALEIFDEEEDFKIKCDHYFLLTAFNDKYSTNAFSNLKLETQLLNIYTPYFIEKVSCTWESSMKNFQISIANRWGSSAVYFNSKIICFGGFGGNKTHCRLNDILTWDTKNLQIEEVKNVNGIIPSKRLFHTATLIGHQMFIIGGREGPFSPCSDGYVLDLNSMTWSSLPQNGDIPSPRWKHSTTAVGSKIYLFGGRNYQNVFNDLYEFDISTFTWKNLIPNSFPNENLPMPRYSHSINSIQNSELLILFGGIHDSVTIFNDVWLFNIPTSEWKQIVCSNGIIPPPTFSHSSFVHNNQLYIVGGYYESSKVGNDVGYVLGLSSFTWRNLSIQNSFQSSDKKRMLVKHSAIMVEDARIFIIGGGAMCFSFGIFFNPPDILILEQSKKLTEIGAKLDLSLLNWQTVPKISNPTSEMFHEIIRYGKPVILTNVDIGTCTSTWSLEHLKKFAGEETVSVHVADTPILNFLTRNFKFETMPLKQLVDYILQHNANKLQTKYYYLRSIGKNPRKDVSDFWQSFPQLASDFKVPKCCSSLADPQAPNTRYFSSAFRVSSPEVQMWTHYDIMDNVLCQIKGNKRVVLWPPDQIQYLYVISSTSKVLDIDYPDLQQFPEFSKAKSVECILREGEVLFIPALWFHNTKAFEASISVNVFWKGLDDIFYEKKDLYGNKDLLLGTKAMTEVENAIAALLQLPEPYRTFYAYRALTTLKDKLQL